MLCTLMIRLPANSAASPLLLLLLLFTIPARPQNHPPPGAPSLSLFTQSAVEILQREFPDDETSYLLLDARSGAPLARHWPHPQSPIPVGSLVKPFTALAYASAHEFRYPFYECMGKRSGCWQDQPHGKLDISSAISVSCNAYFRHLADTVTAEQLAQVTRSFNLESPEDNFNSGNLIGLGRQWRISPLHLAQAYLELYRRKDQPGVAPILEGMHRSALRGTGAAFGHQLHHTEALVKTGTAPCTHARWAPADGFVLALLPADRPQILLLLRIHGVAGASAAETAARVLSQIEE